MRGRRAGADKLAIVQLINGIDVGTIDLMSPAFANEGRLPPRFTADGAGLSPPLVWGTLPPKTAAIALIVEDAGPHSEDSAAGGTPGRRQDRKSIRLNSSH